MSTTRNSRTPWRRIALSGAIAAVTVVGLAAPAQAATTIVNESSLGSSWSTADTRPGGSVAFVPAADAPLGNGALELDTDATNEAKAQLLTTNYVGTPLADITTLGFSSKTLAGPSYAAPSFQLELYVNGADGYTTMVYEPYQNGTVNPGSWQTWDVSAGKFWSSRTVGAFTAGSGGAPFYTLAQIKAAAPNAVVLRIGLNVGTYNPGYSVLADALTVNDDTYDFEPVVFSKDDCKNGGWETNWPADMFKNQGDCVSYFASGGKTHPHG